jgi:hypothetical protein
MIGLAGLAAIHAAPVVGRLTMRLPPLPRTPLHDDLHAPHAQERSLQVVVEAVLARLDHEEIRDVGEGLGWKRGEDVLEVAAADSVSLALVVKGLALPEKGGASFPLAPGAKRFHDWGAIIARSPPNPFHWAPRDTGCTVEGTRIAPLSRVRRT